MCGAGKPERRRHSLLDLEVLVAILRDVASNSVDGQGER